jgi:hypothetical protein
MPTKATFNKAFYIFSVLLGILFLQVSTLQAVDYVNFVFIGSECSAERTVVDSAETAYQTALDQVHELDALVFRLKARNLFGSARKAKKHYEQLKQATNDLVAAQTEASRLYREMDDANLQLILCIKSIICLECEARTDHFSNTCDTCDATNIYTCQHYCPNVPRCSGCGGEISDSNTAFHEQVTCSGCNFPYYYCYPMDAEYHRPRLCSNHAVFWSDGLSYYEFEAQRNQLPMSCNQLFRECSNVPCVIGNSGYSIHKSSGSWRASCPSCSGMSFLIDSCPLHD